jgi:hypothetical protein
MLEYFAVKGNCGAQGDSPAAPWSRIAPGTRPPPSSFDDGSRVVAKGCEILSSASATASFIVADSV